MVEAWFHSPCNFVYGLSLIVWFKHFCLWSRLGFTIQTFLFMVEVWFYGPSTFVYGPSLIVWSKFFFLCSSLVLNTLNLSHALTMSDYLRSKMFYFQVFLSLCTFKMLKHILIFQKKLKVKVLCQFLEDY
jgi:hypothetical protein